MRYSCTNCEEYGLHYNRNYPPIELIEGKVSSQIIIIGLNPKGDKDKIDNTTKEEIENFNKNYPYYKDFEKVYSPLYNLMGKENGVAHLDIVKCYCNEFPPKGSTTKQKQEIINNCCKNYLKLQIKQIKPKMIICNGADVCKIIIDLIPHKYKSEKNETYYIGIFNNIEIIVVLSGFIGRIDDYSKRRLGKEIEELYYKMTK